MRRRWSDTSLVSELCSYYFIYQLFKIYHSYNETHLLDFNKQELQSLVRVVALICKDKRENTVIEGLKCLRVSNPLFLSPFISFHHHYLHHHLKIIIKIIIKIIYDNLLDHV